MAVLTSPTHQPTAPLATPEAPVWSYSLHHQEQIGAARRIIRIRPWSCSLHQNWDQTDMVFFHFNCSCSSALLEHAKNNVLALAKHAKLSLSKSPHLE